MDKAANQINFIREQTLADLSPELLNHHSTEIYISPSNNFIAKVTEYLNGIRSCQLEILNAKTGEQMQLLFTNDSCYHSWATKEGIEYLIFAEDLPGGQTIVDLTNNKLASFSLNDPSGWIWTSHFVSPNEKLLAVVGCGWGTDFWVKVYKFDEPMNLPLTEIYDSTGSVNKFLKWQDNNSFWIRLTDLTEKLIKLNLDS